MAWLTFILSGLKRVPLRVWLLLAFLAACAFALWYAHHAGVREGRQEIQSQWDESIERGKRELARREAERAKITVKTEKVYVDRIRVVREKGQTLIQRIPAMVPPDACLLPVGFRVSHDHAAAGTVPDTADGTDGSAAAAESIAWRPWDSRAGAASRTDRGRKLQPVSPAGRTAQSVAGVDPRAGGR